MTQARKIIRRSPKRRVGALCFPHLSNNQIEWESTLERDAYSLFAFCPTVAGLETQPIELQYTFPNETIKRVYFPDACVMPRLGRPIYVEVKPVDDINMQENRVRFPIIHRVFEEKGARFEILSDAVIRSEPRLKNVKFLLRYRNILIEAQQKNDLLEMCCGSELSISELVDKTGIDLGMLYATVAQGVLSVDLEKLITTDSLLKVCSRADEYSHEILFDEQRVINEMLMERGGWGMSNKFEDNGEIE